MQRVRDVIRLLTIQAVISKKGLDRLIRTQNNLSVLKALIWLHPLRWFALTRGSSAVALRETFIELGPIFVKFGQALSTRRDFLSEEMANELTKLQDKVPPFSGEQARAIIEETHQQSIEELFLEFSITPLASASISQVHAAKLKDGTDVIVKVLRPDVKKQIKRDVRLMYTFAALAEKYSSEARRLRLHEVVEEFDKTIMDELDMLREAANAKQLRRNFENSDLLYVPDVFWRYTKTNVLVMERVSGVPIGDMETLKSKKVNLKKLAERGVEIFFTQVFCHSFFHADMHPGNIFVSVSDPNDPKYICVDFGIIGTLVPSDKRYLAENFHAFFKRDYHRVAQLHVESGWVPPDTRVDELESAIRTVCEPIFDRPLSEISFAQMLLRLFQTGRRFNMEIQPQLILLQKTLFAIEGLGCQLYPKLDLWKNAQPFIEEWLKEELSPTSFFSHLKDHAPYWVEQFPKMPTLLYDYFSSQKEMFRRDAHTAAVKAKQVTHSSQKRSKKKSFLAGIATGLLVSSLFWFEQISGAVQRIWIQAPVISVLLIVMGTVLLSYIWLEN